MWHSAAVIAGRKCSSIAGVNKDLLSISHVGVSSESSIGTASSMSLGFCLHCAPYLLRRRTGEDSWQATCLWW